MIIIHHHHSLFNELSIIYFGMSQPKAIWSIDMIRQQLSIVAIHSLLRVCVAWGSERGLREVFHKTPSKMFTNNSHCISISCEVTFDWHRCWQHWMRPQLNQSLPSHLIIRMDIFVVATWRQSWVFNKCYAINLQELSRRFHWIHCQIQSVQWP